MGRDQELGRGAGLGATAPPLAGVARPGTPSGAASRPVLDVRAVTKVYGPGEATVHALRGVSLTVEPGDYVAIMGSSGSGKSTLMNILAPTTTRWCGSPGRRHSGTWRWVTR